MGRTNETLQEAHVSTPFGPQLIGEAEKTLNAILRKFLEGTGLTEPEWVTLRIATARDGVEGGGDGDLASAVSRRAHFADADDLVLRSPSAG